MDSKSILKRKIRFFFVAFFLFLSFCGCDLRAGRYPFQVAAEWACDTPDFLLTYTETESGGKVESEVLKWDGKEIAVNISFGLGDYCVYPENSVAYGDRLFSGTWEYRDSNLVLFIDEDFLFESQYTELVFSPVEID